jgi:hypothetical protein
LLGEKVGKQFDRASFALGVQRKEDRWKDCKRLASTGVIGG